VFWTDERRGEFRAIFLQVKKKFSLTYPGMVQAINLNVERKNGDGDVIDPRTIMRFKSDQKETEPDNLSLILMGISETILQRQGMLIDEIECSLPLIRMYVDLLHYKGESDVEERVRHFFDKVPADLVPSRAAVESDEDYRPLPFRPVTKAGRRRDIVKFLAAFSRKSNGSSSVEKKFFRNGDPDKIYFITYRFSATPSILQRSFTVIHRPTSDVPLVRFSNFFGDADAPRRSGGIGINFDHEVVFLGHSDLGGSIKVLSFSEIRKPKDQYFGLLMTNDPEGGSLASRFLMIRTSTSNHVDAQTGPVEISELKKQIGVDLTDRLRNKVKFGLEEPVIDTEGRTVSQRDMVTLVGRRLYDDEVPMLRDSSGFFNPADDFHYTFNSALKRDD
jgi:hypothetical protein